MSKNIDKTWTFLVVAKYCSLVLLVISLAILVSALGSAFFGWDLVITAAKDTNPKPEDLSGLVGLLVTYVSLIATIAAAVSLVIFLAIFIITAKKLKHHSRSSSEVTSDVIAPGANVLPSAPVDNENVSTL